MQQGQFGGRIQFILILLLFLKNNFPLISEIFISIDENAN